MVEFLNSELPKERGKVWGMETEVDEVVFLVLALVEGLSSDEAEAKVREICKNASAIEDTRVKKRLLETIDKFIPPDDQQILLDEVHEIWARNEH